MNYQVMRRAFQWTVRDTPDRLRELAGKLLEPHPDYPAQGSSFALTVRPHWTLWLSEASSDRLREAGLLNVSDVATGRLCRPDPDTDIPPARGLSDR